MSQLQITYVEPGLLNPADYNPRTLTPAARRKLKASLQTFGVVDPVIARQEDGLIIGGHQRFDVMVNDLQFTEVPVIFLEGISDERAKALNVALNNPELQGSFDEQRLAGVVQSVLAQEEFDPTVMGWDRERLEHLAAWEPPAPIVPDYEGTAKIHHFKIGIYDVPMSPDENERFTRMVQTFANERGVLFGFVTWMLDNAHRFSRKTESV